MKAFATENLDELMAVTENVDPTALLRTNPGAAQAATDGRKGAQDRQHNNQGTRLALLSIGAAARIVPLLTCLLSCSREGSGGSALLP